MKSELKSRTETTNQKDYSKAIQEHSVQSRDDGVKESNGDI